MRREGDPGHSPIRRCISLRKVVLAAPQTPTGQDRAGSTDSCLDSESDERELRVPPNEWLFSCTYVSGNQLAHH